MSGRGPVTRLRPHLMTLYWLRRKLRALHTTVMLWLFFAWGKKLWPYIREQHNNHGRTTAMFFAQDEREMNIAARAHVEWLDQGR